MPKETVNGVTNFYGPRSRGDTQGGQIKTEGAVKQLVIFFTGENYLQQRATLPAGAIIHGQATVEVAEAFNLGGTTPVINVGVLTTEGTNRLAQVTEANAEAVGTYSYATAGTLAQNTPLTAAATIAIALGGTTPTATTAGLAKLVVEYRVL
jgi:hypothetical protein